MKCRSLAALMSLICLAGCSSGDRQASTPDTIATPSTTEAPATTVSTATIPVPPGFESMTTTDGRTRTYRVVDLSDGGPAPLLFVLHGFGGTAEGMREYAGLEAALENTLDTGVIVVYPNGTGSEEGLPQSWNGGGCCPFAIYDMVDDVAFLDELIGSLTTRYDIDTDHVWVAGHSNGGMMAYRLACELSNRITAIGVAAGALMIETCAPSRGVSALHVHGNLDAVVPIAGGETAGIVFPSASDSFEWFARANGCEPNGNEASCTDGNRVTLVTNTSWAHDWVRDWTSLFANFFADQARA